LQKVLLISRTSSTQEIDVPEKLDQIAVRTRRERYLHELEKEVTPEETRLRLAAMAHAMQMTLSLPKSAHGIKKHYALEVLLRAIAHEIEGDSTRRNYVREKARVGYEMLMEGLD
jgi:hypothetical protein